MDKKEKVNRAFIMEPEAATMFFILVKFALDHGSKDSEKFRMSVLNWMAKNNMMLTVFDTKRTKDKIIEDYEKHGMSVADYTSGREKTLVCQECGDIIQEDESVKISNEGWICTMCLDKWRHWDND
jgi:hypothetical protein